MSLQEDPFLPMFVAVPIAEAVKRAEPPPTIEEAEFAAWWKEWPSGRRVDKERARVAYARARTKVSPAELLYAIRRYAERCVLENTPTRYICHPTTWLNNERWGAEGNGEGLNGDGGTAAAGPGNRNGHGTASAKAGAGRADALIAAGLAAGARVRAHQRDR